nr:putative E3 ubiquitin-protein ligase UBR7 [Ipomoea batatas]
MTDAFEEEAEPTVSIGEYLKDVEEQELEADLVLGGDEGKECTYNNGYMKRQAIFSCLTCTPDGNAGVCTACSLSCHDGHEIVELWTKRNFRCDCGNSKFGEFFCKLLASKDVENTQNLYNHNFRGLYCTCGRPYPDPDAEEQAEMIQCCVCEDWFHEEHLGLESSDMQVPRDEEGEPIYEEFICQGCASVCSFLMLYPPTVFASVPQKSATSSLKEKEVAESVPPLSSEETNNARVGYLLDPEDTIAEYEAMAKQKREQLEQQLSSEFLSKLGHIEKMEILTGIADIKNELHSYLASFDPSKAVTSADIHQSATGLRNQFADWFRTDCPLSVKVTWHDFLMKFEVCVNWKSWVAVSQLTGRKTSLEDVEICYKRLRIEYGSDQDTNALVNITYYEKYEFDHTRVDMKWGNQSINSSHDVKMVVKCLTHSSDLTPVSYVVIQR